MMLRVTKMEAVEVHLEVRVCSFSIFFFVDRNDVVSHPLDSPLPSEKAPNGIAPRVPSGVPPVPASLPPAVAALNKAPTGRDPKSRARSREYLKQCLQEISYLTSPQAMNPLPNRPLISNPNPSMGLGGNVMNPGATGGVGLGGTMSGGMGGVGQGQGMVQGQGPSPFDTIYNGRPRKQLPDSAGPGISNVGVPGKEFPMLGSSTGSGAIGVMSGPGNVPASSGPLERANQLAIAGTGMYQQQQQPPVQAQPQQQENQLQRNLASSQPPSQPQTQPSQQQQDGIGQAPAIRQEGDVPKQTTMIFRPDDAGEWKEKLRSSYEQHVQQWRESEDEEPEEVGEEEDEEAVGVVDEADGESTKHWKAKRTLRK